MKQVESVSLSESHDIEVQVPPERKNYTQTPNYFFLSKILTIIERGVLEAILSVCRTEGPHKITYRQIASIAGVSHSILCPDEKRGKEGIMKKFANLGYIGIVLGREINPATGEAIGKTQTYLYVNYTKIWKENEEYFQTRKSLVEAFRVQGHNFQIEATDFGCNTTDMGSETTNHSDITTDVGRDTTDIGCNTRSNNTQNKQDKFNTTKTKKTGGSPSQKSLRAEWYHHFDQWYRLLPGNEPTHKEARNSANNQAIDTIIERKYSVEKVHFIFSKIAQDSFWKQHLNIPRVVEKYPVWIGEYKPVPQAQMDLSVSISGTDEQAADEQAADAMIEKMQQRAKSLAQKGR